MAADEDPWTRVTSVNGFAADELVSALQKNIRRGRVEEAVIVAFELYESSPELEDYLWRRLEIISVEDIGFGRPDAPVIIDALSRLRLRTPRGRDERRMYALHAVRLLASSKKDRSTDEMIWWLLEMRNRGELKVEIPDVALDVHTRRGKEMGRGDHHFLMEGARLENELEDRDLTYYQRLLKLVQPD